MENSSSTMFWVVGAIVIAAGIIFVANKMFPNITNKVGGFMQTMVDKAQGNVMNSFDKQN